MPGNGMSGHWQINTEHDLTVRTAFQEFRRLERNNRMVQEISIVSPESPALLHAVEGDGCAVGGAESAGAGYSEAAALVGFDGAEVGRTDGEADMVNAHDEPCFAGGQIDGPSADPVAQKRRVANHDAKGSLDGIPAAALHPDSAHVPAVGGYDEPDIIVSPAREVGTVERLGTHLLHVCLGAYGVAPGLKIA